MTHRIVELPNYAIAKSWHPAPQHRVYLTKHIVRPSVGVLNPETLHGAVHREVLVVDRCVRVSAVARYRAATRILTRDLSYSKSVRRSACTGWLPGERVRKVVVMAQLGTFDKASRGFESRADAHYDNLESLHVTSHSRCLNQPFW